MKAREGLWLSFVILFTGQMTAAGRTGLPWAVLKGPELIYLNHKIEFHCEGSPLPATYQYMKVNQSIPLATNYVSVGHPPKFHFKVTHKSAGGYYCTVTALGKTATSNVLHLQIVIPVSGAHLLSVPSPPTAFQGSSLALYCEVQKGSHLSYTWYHNRLAVTSPSPMYNLSGNSLIVDKLTKRHAGSYYCSARNNMDHPRISSSTEIHVTVKAHLSAPKLSFAFFSENSSYYANLSCASAEGSVPVTFLLLLEGQEIDRQVANSLSVWFSVPMTVEMDVKTVQCRAETSHQHLNSNLLNLEMAPVGGAVHLQVQYLYNANWQVVAVQLQCDISRGTFPSFSWLHNNSLLQQRDCSTVTDQCHVLFLTDVIPAHSGYYQCLVKDSFDNNQSSWLHSNMVLAEAIDLPTMTTRVIIVVLCCILGAILMGNLFCILWWFKCLALQSEGVTIPQQHSEAVIIPALPLRTGHMVEVTANEDLL